MYWHFWLYFDIYLKLLSGKNTQKVKKQNIRDRKIGCSMSSTNVETEKKSLVGQSCFGGTK